MDREQAINNSTENYVDGELFLRWNHFRWLWMLFNVTINDIQSYMWRHIDVPADRKSWTYGRAPNAIDIS